MSLTTEMQQKIFESLNDGYGQVKFFQDSVVILDNDKSGDILEKRIKKSGHMLAVDSLSAMKKKRLLRC